MKKFNMTTKNIQLDKNNQSEKRRVNEMFTDLLKNNTTMKDIEINISLKPGHCPVKQMARPLPSHLQEAVSKYLEKLTKTGHSNK